ncbi:hypothetical protein [Microtetraspora niveoalba]|uniref:hypothetical protein n=1 Tax=Microtetraspora niveoalba TaxID=46175 RepID=UPI00082C020B|nr:hypothetical protein [Microtetraspora niveoalba]
MTIPSQNPRAGMVPGLAVAGAAVLGLALVAAPAVAVGASGNGARAAAPNASPSPGGPSVRTVLTCAAATADAKPITFTPPVGQQTATVKATGTLKLTGCTSPDNSFPNLRSAKVTIQGSGQVSCTGVEKVTGTGTITWSDAQGKEVGTSTIVPNVDQVNSYNPGDMLLFGEITSGKLKGTRTMGKATPTSDISQCSTKGIGSVTGSGTVSFIAVG